MIITLIGIFMTIFAIICQCISNYIFNHRYDTTEKLYRNNVINVDEVLDGFAAFNFVVGGIIVFISIIMIIVVHTGIEPRLQKQQIQYETLCNEYDMIKNEVEVSDKVRTSYAQIMDNIAEWNQDTISEQYWANNLWTNWFYSKKLANARKIIKIE